MTKEELEGYLAEGLSLEQIGKRVGRHPSTVSYHLKKHGLRPVNQQRHRERGPIPQTELKQLHAQGASLKEIADHFDRGVNTVRYWLQKYGLGPTAGGLRRAAIKQARLAGKRDVELECLRHGTTAHVLEKGGRVRCKRCRSEAVSESRRRIKRILVEEAGGACLICGYHRCIAALEFHHRDRKKKLFALSRKGATRSLEKARAEARKCILLCSNCHVEVENGVTKIPLRLIREEAPEDGNLTRRAA
jgi:DNA-binding CsgD family transcriptional regulator